MEYQPQNFTNLIGTPGFSDKLLTAHFGLYEGYVKNVNALSKNLSSLPEGAVTPEFSELRRRFGWEWNGMRLHELYFTNMTKESVKRDTNKDFTAALTKYFGSIDAWEKDFKATGTMRGIGWTILYHDPETKKLFNTWVEEHAMGHLAGCAPLFVLDVFEHAYVADYGIKRAEYIDAFMAAANWNCVAERFKKSTGG